MTVVPSRITFCSFSQYLSDSLIFIVTLWAHARHYGLKMACETQVVGISCWNCLCFDVTNTVVHTIRQQGFLTWLWWWLRRGYHRRHRRRLSTWCSWPPNLDVEWFTSWYGISWMMIWLQWWFCWKCGFDNDDGGSFWNIGLSCWPDPHLIVVWSHTWDGIQLIRICLFLLSEVGFGCYILDCFL